MIKDKKQNTNVISVRNSPEMDEMISYLKNKLLLNSSALVRYCVARVYAEEKNKESD